MEANEIESLPWYLQRNTLSGFAVLLPPLAFLLVFFNRHRLSPSTKSGIRFFSTLMTGLWILKLLPHNAITFSLVIFSVLLSVFFLIIRLLR